MTAFRFSFRRVVVYRSSLAVAFRFACRPYVADVGISPLYVSIGRGVGRGASICR